ncbi:LysR family transcriptional regulator [Pseudomonas fluorescens group sp.]|uniref:LysR family transcriptional regulator n=2 Tax=Pseudomonas fluorescens TaxID=294 RepID=C3KAX5_PSEFS|nr:MULTISPECIES: LysR family transcriptional regulator [Pseudomonas fluorescens group]MBZ6457647.1 LysR family transcriptional regulator [Pseudomonas fluorescens group sp.]MBZ6463971.1 LysR family transcriptional regulator [Pseudomonas fluorescens group sp.]MBZ6468883.1 LysR family transcriptional regulator [Pseudomonas fluorescens group sp.]WQD74978.1 LysR family transcriptional regulator [Pseudomonas marginalis]CAI2796993.1 Putative LysR family transcriptional regulator [Pseudomonas fluoresc
MADLNLLITLDVLLAEGSVAGAARRLRLSPSAMSRALARLRETTGDPLLVRAGRGLVPTPRAMELREQVSRLVQEASAVLRPVHTLDMAQVERTFTLRTSEEFVENVGAALLARTAREAPGVRLRFIHKTDKDSALLRDGSVDLETGVVDPAASPEVLTQALFRDRLVGVVRSGHALSQGDVSARRYAEGQHVYVSRRGQDRGQIDDALEAQGLTRQISTIVAGFATAIALARDTDLIASVPERYTFHQREGLHRFELPVALPTFTVAMLWHPRLDADLAHRWLRGCLREVCAEQVQSALP